MRRVAARVLVATLVLGGVAGVSGTARADEIGTPTQVAPPPSETVMMSADGTYLVYSSNGLYGRPVAGTADALLSPATPDRNRLEISADGSIIGFITPIGDAHVVDRQRGTDELIATGLTASDRLYVAQLTTTVWYSKTTGSGAAVFSHDAALVAGPPNSDAPLSLAASPSVFVVDWQGSRVLYSTSGVTAVRQYTVASGADQVLLTITSLTRDNDAISPTGRYLADGIIVLELPTGRIMTVATTADGRNLSAVRPRFSLDEKWVAVVGGFRPGTWLFPMVQSPGPSIARRVTHDEMNDITRFPATVDPNAGNVAFTALVDASGPTYATYTSPVVLDTTPPQATILTQDGEFVWLNNPLRVHITDGGAGIDRLLVQTSSSTYGDSSSSMPWFGDPGYYQCVSDAAGVRDDRDCVVSYNGFRGGDYTVTVEAVDVDGNQSAPQTVHIHADTTAPTVTGSPDRTPNAGGWYRAPVTVSWTASDPDNSVSNPPATTVSTDGRNQVVQSASVCDPYRNCGMGMYTLSLDQAPPTVSATADSPPGAGGWYSAPVRVNFSCADALSGVASCPASVTVGTEGRNQVVKGTGTDVAGNSTDAQTSVSVDLSPPSASVTSGSAILAALNQRLTGTAADSLSGVAHVDVYMTNGVSSASESSSDNSLSLTCNTARTNCSWSARPPIVGNVTFYVTAVDVVGHMTSFTATAYVL